MRNVYLIWLEWPEKCFRVDAKALLTLRSLVPPSSRIIRARTEEEFLKHLGSATHAIVWHFKAQWYSLAKNLKVLATPGAGRELVAYKEAPKNITVHFGGYHGQIIAESVVGFMFAWAHGFFRPELRQADAKGKAWASSWPRTLLGDKCSLVASTNAVIVGYGRIGQHIGAKLTALGVKVHGFSRKNIADIKPALKKADWLILALPSDTGTDNFFNSIILRSLPRKCVVINIGRGNAVDEQVLIEALFTGRIAGAYLDVFRDEPGPLSKIASLCSKKGILKTPAKKLPQNLIRMPHSSAFCAEYVEMCFKELKDDGLI